MNKPTYWQAHINAWSGSGQSQKAYCKAHELSFHTFQYWRKRLQSADPASPPSGFQPLGIARLPAGLSLALPGGFTIHGDGHTMATLLVQLQQAGFFYAQA